MGVDWQYCQQILHGTARVGAVSGGFKVYHIRSAVSAPVDETGYV